MKKQFFYGILISSAIFLLLDIPSSSLILTLLAFLFLLLNILLAPALVRSKLIQSGYKIIPPALILLLMCLYIFGMYHFSKAWLNNLQHILWNIIYDNLTSLLSIAVSLLYAGVLICYYFIHKKISDDG